MDPASVIALAGSVLSIVDVIARNVTALSTLQAKYRNADLNVFLLIGQLSTLKAALGQIAEWIKFEHQTARSEHLQLFEDLGVAVNGCQVLIMILDERVVQLANKDGSDSLNVKSKIAFLWEEQELNMYVTHLNNQVNALTLLLSAVHCRSSSQERTLLQSLENRQVIQRLRDDTSSLLWLRDSESIFSKRTAPTFNSKLLSTVFDFDGEVFNSKAYQMALRSNMKQVLSHKVLRHLKPSNVASPDVHATFFLEEDTADVDTETIIPKPVSSTSPLPTAANQGTRQVVPQKISLWSWISEQMGPRKKNQLDTRNEIVDLQRDNPTWNGKTLVLGTGESGKSTLVKSLKLYTEGSYDLEERSLYKKRIFKNVIESARVVLWAMEDLQLLLDDQRTEYHVQTIFAQPAQGEEISSEVVEAIRNLYVDSGFRGCLERAREYQLNDSAEYYFISITRLGNPSYVPTEEDILRSRVKTTGIQETVLYPAGKTYNVFDVGGFRSERKKWIHCFEDVGAVLFTVDIGCWDQLLWEDEGVNRMQEALSLFDSIVNSRWFVKSKVALIFTKYDKLAAKLESSPLKNYFTDYERNNNLEEATAYITDRFVSLNQHKTKLVEVYYTSIVDGPQSLGKTAMEALQQFAQDT